jgi:hypothetical protein
MNKNETKPLRFLKYPIYRDWIIYPFLGLTPLGLIAYATHRSRQQISVFSYLIQAFIIFFVIPIYLRWLIRRRLARTRQKKATETKPTLSPSYNRKSDEAENLIPLMADLEGEKRKIRNAQKERHKVEKLERKREKSAAKLQKREIAILERESRKQKAKARKLELEADISFRRNSPRSPGNPGYVKVANSAFSKKFKLNCTHLIIAKSLPSKIWGYTKTGDEVWCDVCKEQRQIVEEILRNA